MRARSIRAALLVIVAFAAAPAGAETLYRQPVWPAGFSWSHADIDVVIVPPNHGQLYNGNGALNGLDADELNPLANSYLRAIERSVADWDRAVAAYAPTWLKKGLKVNTYVVGRDDVPADTLRNPDVVIATDLTKAAVLGIALRQGARTCVVLNSKFFITSMTYADMFNINSQEYGHCLGLGHVNEASPPNPDDAKMRHDVMNGFYAHDPGATENHVHCVSNLNVAGLVEAFRETLTGSPGARYGIVGASSYARVNSCG